MSIPIFQFNHPPLPPGNHKFIFYLYNSISKMYAWLHVLPSQKSYISWFLHYPFGAVPSEGLLGGCLPRQSSVRPWTKLKLTALMLYAFPPVDTVMKVLNLWRGEFEGWSGSWKAGSIMCEVGRGNSVADMKCQVWSGTILIPNRLLYVVNAHCLALEQTWQLNKVMHNLKSQ